MTAIAATLPNRFFRSVRRTQVSSYAVVAVVALLLWAFVVSPMLLTFQRGFEAAGAESSARLFGAWSGPVPQALLGSVVLALLSVISAGVSGVTLAVLLQRWEFPFRRGFHALVLSPLALPPFMGVAAFAKLYGYGGIVPSFLGSVSGVDPNVFVLDGLVGVLLVHTITMYPYFYLPVSTALRQMDSSLEEAAYSLGASTPQTWRRVILPMLTPAIVSGALLTFMSSMGSYTAPLLFGVNKVLTRQIALANDNGDLAFASALSAVLCLFSIGFLLAFRAYERRASYWTASKGGARRRCTRVRPAGQAALFAATAAASAFVILPMALILLLAFAADGTWRASLLPAEYGLQNFDRFTAAGAWAPIANSLQMSALAAGAATVLGLSCAWIVGRMRVRGRTPLEIAIMLPWALPGTVIAFNLIAAFNGPSVFTFGYTLVGTWAIVPLAYVVRFSPMVFRSTTASLAQMDPALEEAARSLGASAWSAFRRVTLPLVSPGLSAGALLAFVAGIGEFVSTTMLHAQDRYKPLSIAIFEEYYRGNLGTAAAWGVVQIVLVLAALVAVRRLETRADNVRISVA